MEILCSFCRGEKHENLLGYVESQTPLMGGIGGGGVVWFVESEKLRLQ